MAVMDYKTLAKRGSSQVKKRSARKVSSKEHNPNIAKPYKWGISPCSTMLRYASASTEKGLQANQKRYGVGTWSKLYKIGER